MRRSIAITLCLLISILASAQKRGMLLIDFDPYEDYFINIDGRAYHTNKSSVLIPDLIAGEHDVIVVPKSRNTQALDFTIQTNGSKNHYVLQRTLVGMRFIKYDARNNPNRYVSDIVIQADSIVTDSVAELETDCFSYSDYEMNFIRNQYLESRSKPSFLRQAFDNKCIKPKQLMSLLEVSITTEEKLSTLKVLAPYATSDTDLSVLDPDFRNTRYYRDYLKILKKYGE